MVIEKIVCPYCGSDRIVKHEKNKQGKQRYRCGNPECSRSTFLLDYTHNGRKQAVQEQIVRMAVNGSRIRDTARVLHVSKDTVMKLLKKEEILQNVNTGYIKSLPHAETTEIDLECMEPAAAERDEIWSFYHDKKHRLWLWHAIDHQTGTVSAYTFGTREHTVLDELLTPLKPYKIGKVYADHNFAYESRIPGSILEQGKKNTQRIERKHPTLRTRVKRPARKSLCFSKTARMHKIVVGLLISRSLKSI